MSNEKNIYEKITVSYKVFIDNNNPSQERFKAANTIANLIINYELKYNSREKDFLAINQEKNRKIQQEEISNPKFEDKPYSNSPYGKLNFLCKYKYIPPNLQFALNLLLSRGFKQTSKNKEEKSQLSFLSLHEVLNTVLDWFLQERSFPKLFMKPVNIIADNNLDYQKHKKELITSFWHINKGEINRFKKYQTIILILVAISPILTVLLILIDQIILFTYDIEVLTSLKDGTIFLLFGILAIVTFIAGIIGFYSTNRYVNNKKIKFLRYLVFTISIFPMTFVILFSISSILGIYQNDYSFFDRDPYNNGTGFLFIDDKNLNPYLTDSPKRLHKDSINKYFFIRMELKNIGKKAMDLRWYWLDFKVLDSTKTIQASVMTEAGLVHDMIDIIGTNLDEHLDFNYADFAYTKTRYNTKSKKYEYYDSIIKYPLFNEHFRGDLPEIPITGQDNIIKCWITFTGKLHNGGH